jgi:hypothetical protein
MLLLQRKKSFTLRIQLVLFSSSISVKETNLLIHKQDYYALNKEKFQDQHDVYRTMNAAKIKDRKRRYYLKNLDTIKANQREYKRANKAVIKVRNQEAYRRLREAKRPCESLYFGDSEIELNCVSHGYFEESNVEGGGEIRKRRRSNSISISDPRSDRVEYVPRETFNQPWKSRFAVREFFDRIGANEFRIGDLSDWYRVSRPQVSQFGGIVHSFCLFMFLDHYYFFLFFLRSD